MNIAPASRNLSIYMSDLTLTRDNCRLCGNEDLKPAMQLAAVPIVDAYVSAEHLGEIQETYPLDVFLCKICGHSQLRHMLDPDTIYGEYLYFTGSSASLVEHFRLYAESVLGKYDSSAGDLVVDIGSNDGTLLRFFQERGMRVLGIDPARKLAEVATQAGVETWPTYFSTELARHIREEYGPAAIVTVNNVFANVDDTIDMVEGIREMMSPDGLMVFETFYLLDLVENLAFDFIFHEHLSCYSVKPLQAFFQAHGMQLVDIQRVPTKGGSIRGFVRLGETQSKAPLSVAESICRENELGIHTQEAFEGLSRKIDSTKNQLLTLLQRIQGEGKTVAGYGASAATTTLLYQFELGDKLSFIADDNPTRQDLFSPGLHIPVKPPQEIYDSGVDYVLILAWRHGQAIMSKHPEFLARGGHFIVPLPEVEVI